MMRRALPVLVLLCLMVSTAAQAAPANPQQVVDLARRLDPLLNCLNGKAGTFALNIQMRGAISDTQVEVDVQVVRFADDAWRLSVHHDEYPLVIERTAERTLLLLPRHRSAIVSEGLMDTPDSLAAAGLGTRLVSPATEAFAYYLMLANSTGQSTAVMLTSLLELQPSEQNPSHWIVPKMKDVVLDLSGEALTVRAVGATLSVHMAPVADQPATPMAIPDDYRISVVDRTEMERTLSRAPRRALEVLAPGKMLTQPVMQGRVVPNGELRWEQGQRLVLLHGTPEEIGAAHAQLLAPELMMMRDSVLHMFGAVQTIRTGRWFNNDLREAWARLEPFIPQEHQREMASLAQPGGFGADEARFANIFPELFHCSGFAVFGKATQDGKLYHGRVLDYMTMIGLQDAAALFVIAPEGKIPFATVGYAGFIGSVTGMNQHQVSLGEMGGRGEGQWDGVPMSILMRRALEECSTLEQVMQLWSQSPRTCEYFYVFADGKIPSAVGVGATPESIEFIHPGESHPRLGEGIEDTVLLSAGERLMTLRQRVQSDYGAINAEKAIQLMARGVAMKSNLHNALFVPQDLVIYVAHADHQRPAADTPYARFELDTLFQSLAR